MSRVTLPCRGGGGTPVSWPKDVVVSPRPSAVPTADGGSLMSDESAAARCRRETSRPAGGVARAASREADGLGEIQSCVSR